MRECLEDVQAYNTVEEGWNELKCDGVFERRRYHVACIVGKYMIVHGGLNSAQQYLSDTTFLTLGKMNEKEYRTREYRWLKLATKGPSPQRVAYHTCQLVLNRERYRYIEQVSPYSLPELRTQTSKV